jgi:hypothetical protein
LKACRFLDFRVILVTMQDDISTYNASQPAELREVCARLAREISEGLPIATAKVWHGGPVWSLNGNPITGYWVRKKGVQLLFWSGQSFDEPKLEKEGKFKAAQTFYASPAAIDSADLQRWLAKAAVIQWDYKNIVKRKGQLEKIGDWDASGNP